MRQAKQIEARLLEEVGTGRHKGSRSGTMAELLERWLEWRPTVRPIAPTTVEERDRVSPGPVPAAAGHVGGAACQDQGGVASLEDSSGVGEV
jgi:hypothetical protein